MIGRMDGSSVLLAGATLAASFGGYALAGLNEARRDRRAAARDRQSRAEDVQLRRDEERHQIQLEALIALQEDVQLLARHCGKVLAFDLSWARKGEYKQTPAGWGEDELAVRMRLSRNLSRIFDSDLREQVEAFNRLTAELGTLPGIPLGLPEEELVAASMRQVDQLTTQSAFVLKAIGEAIRGEIAPPKTDDDV